MLKNMCYACDRGKKTERLEGELGLGLEFWPLGTY